MEATPDSNLYFQRNGKPYEGTRSEQVEQWGKDRENKNHKHIKQDVLPDGKYVSTTWLGTDHRLHGDGLPLIFETMVFDSKDRFIELDIKFHSTEAEALAGHEAMITRWTRP